MKKKLLSKIERLRKQINHIELGSTNGYYNPYAFIDCRLTLNQIQEIVNELEDVPTSEQEPTNGKVHSPVHYG